MNPNLTHQRNSILQKLICQKIILKQIHSPDNSYSKKHIIQKTQCSRNSFTKKNHTPLMSTLYPKLVMLLLLLLLRRDTVT